MERRVEILEHSCQDLEFTTELATRFLLPRPCRQLNHITASMHYFSFELLMLNLSVLLRKFLLNVHLNRSTVVPHSGGRDYKMNLVGSQPVRLLHILVKSTWARITGTAWAQGYPGKQWLFFNWLRQNSKALCCRIPYYKSGLALILSVTVPKWISWAWECTEETQGKVVPQACWVPGSTCSAQGSKEQILNASDHCLGKSLLPVKIMLEIASCLSCCS